MDTATGGLDTATAGPEAESLEADEVEPHCSHPRYPQRERNPPSYLADYSYRNVLVSNIESDSSNFCIDYCYRVSAVPSTYEKAMVSDDAHHWQKAMDEEISALKANDTYSLSPVPDKNVIGGRWVFDIKSGVNNEPRYKARYVAKGFSQIPEIDYTDTFAPTARIMSIRILLQLSAQYNMTLYTLDFHTAYLNANIDKEIYVEQPKGYAEKSSDGQKLVWKLNKSLYGLKQSGRNWNILLDNYLKSQNFSRSYVDSCLYFRFNGNAMFFILIWVDDLLLCSNDDEELLFFKRKLSSQFKMNDVGKLQWFLGIEFKFYKDSVSMSQSNFILKLLERFNMSDCNPKLVPCELNINKISCDESKVLEDPTLYREIVGSLIYLMTCTRPDLSFIVTRLSQYMNRPTNAHLNYAKNVLR